MEYLTFAVDFDDTLYLGGGFPEVKPNCWNMSLVHEILRLQSARPNDKWVLWTCRSGYDLELAVNALSQLPIKWDAINDNTEERKKLYGCNPRKIIADIYIDDRAVSVNSSYGMLRSIK